MNHIYYGISGLIVLVLDVFAIASIVDSDKSILSKGVWTIFVLIIPILGSTIWFLTKSDKVDKYYSDPSDLL